MICKLDISLLVKRISTYFHELGRVTMHPFGIGIFRFLSMSIYLINMLTLIILGCSIILGHLKTIYGYILPGKYGNGFLN